MPIGNMLSANEQQYVAKKDDSGTWRVLNTWHEDLKQLNADDEIDENSPAVVVLSEGQFISLIKEASRVGVLENANFGSEDGELEAIILDRDQEIQKLNDKINTLKEDKSEIVKNTSHSEEYELKEKAMDNILKLVSIHDLSKLGKKE